jgi:hypothetical protein
MTPGEQFGDVTSGTAVGKAETLLSHKGTSQQLLCKTETLVHHN